MSLRRNVVRGVQWTALRQGGTQFLELAFFVVLSRLLVPADFGLAALGAALIAFMGPPVTQGFVVAIVQRRDVEPEHLNVAFWTTLVFALVLSAALYMGSDVFAAVFGEPALAPVLSWLAIGFIALALTAVQEGLLRRQMRFRTLAIRSLAATIVGGGVGITMALAGFGVWSLVGRQLAQWVTTLAVLWAASSWRPQWRFSWQHLRDLASVGTGITGTQLLVAVNRQADHLLIGYFLGTTALGYYRIAYRVLGMGINLLGGTINQVALPAFARLQDDTGRLRDGFYKATQASALIVIPAFIGLALLGEELVLTLYGAKWQPSIPVVEILALVGIAQCMAHTNASLIVAKGRTGLRFLLQTIDGLASVAAVAAVVTFGLVAVASAYTAMAFITAPMWYVAVRRLIGITGRGYLTRVWPAIAASAVMAVTVGVIGMGLPSTVPNWIVLVLGVFSGAGVYWLSLRVLGPDLLLEIRELAQRNKASERKDPPVDPRVVSTGG